MFRNVMGKSSLKGYEITHDLKVRIEKKLQAVSPLVIVKGEQGNPPSIYDWENYVSYISEIKKQAETLKLRERSRKRGGSKSRQLIPEKLIKSVKGFKGSFSRSEIYLDR